MTWLEFKYSGHPKTKNLMYFSGENMSDQIQILNGLQNPNKSLYVFQT